MGNRPSRSAKILIGIICPPTLALMGWWLSAGLRVSGLLKVPESVISASAAAGLAAGITLDIVFLKRWALRLYDARVWLIVVLFLFWSLAVFAFFMGVPIGNLVLGTLAGGYVGARLARSGADSDSVRGVRNAAVFFAVVAGAAAVGAAALALVDTATRYDLGHLFGLKSQPISLPWLVLIAVAGCGLFAALQYVCSRTAGSLAFRHMTGNLRSTGR